MIWRWRASPTGIRTQYHPDKGTTMLQTELTRPVCFIWSHSEVLQCWNSNKLTENIWTNLWDKIDLRWKLRVMTRLLDCCGWRTIAKWLHSNATVAKKGLGGFLVPEGPRKGHESRAIWPRPCSTQGPSLLTVFHYVLDSRWPWKGTLGRTRKDFMKAKKRSSSVSVD